MRALDRSRSIRPGILRNARGRLHFLDQLAKLLRHQPGFRFRFRSRMPGTAVAIGGPGHHRPLSPDLGPRIEPTAAFRPVHRDVGLGMVHHRHQPPHPARRTRQDRPRSRRAGTLRGCRRTPAHRLRRGCRSHGRAGSRRAAHVEERGADAVPPAGTGCTVSWGDRRRILENPVRPHLRLSAASGSRRGKPLRGPSPTARAGRSLRSVGIGRVRPATIRRRCASPPLAGYRVHGRIPARVGPGAESIRPPALAGAQPRRKR